MGLYGSITDAQACLTIVWNSAQRRLKGPAIPNCLRLAFHDAGSYDSVLDVGGANGSIMNELDVATFPQNAGLTLCPPAIQVGSADAVVAGL